MQKRIAILVLSFSWAAPSHAADIGQSPEDNVQICGSATCIQAAWDYFQWCWFGSGLPRYMRMEALDELSYRTTGEPYYREWDYWNEPYFADPKVRRSLRELDLIGSSLYGSDVKPLHDGSSFGSGFGGNVPVKYTAQLGNGLTVEIPATDSGSPRYPVQVVETCNPFGQGYYYIPATETCIKIGGYVRSTNWFGQGGLTYEEQKPKEIPKLRYDYNWSVDATFKYKFDSKLNLTGSYTKDSSYSEEREVDYNKICGVYGQGFYYIPGTDTCLKLGGLLAYQQWSPLRGRVATKLADTPEVKTRVEQPNPQPRETFNTPRPELKTDADQARQPAREVDGDKGAAPSSGKDAKSPPSKKETKDRQKKQQANNEPKAAPVQQAKVQLSSTPRWVDAKTGELVQVGPEGTRTGLFDSNEAFNPETGKSYRKENGVWKDAKTGEVVPEIPIHSKVNKEDPKSATHAYSGRQFRFDGNLPAPQQPPPAAAPPAQAPALPGGQWVDAKTGKPVPVGPDGARPGLFDENEAFNPNTGKSYKKENGVWKDVATGKEVPEIPINSQADASDPGKAKHSYNDRTFVKVSPQAQAEAKAGGIKKKLDEAKAKLGSHQPGSLEFRQLKNDIELLENGLDPDEERAKFEERNARAVQLIKDLEETQIPNALSQNQAAKDVYEKEKAALDAMPRDGAGTDPQKRAEQEKKVQQAGRSMFDAANRYWKLSANLKAYKAEYDKYREIRDPTPEQRARQAEQVQQQIKDFSESRLKLEQADRQAMESRYGTVPDQTVKPVTGAKSAEGKAAQSTGGKKGPPKAANDASSSQKQAEKQPEPRDETSIRINIAASIWDENRSGEKKPEPFMVNFQQGYTVPLDLDFKADIGYDESPALAIVRDGKGTYDLAYDRRQSFGLTWAKPGSSFLLGMSMPKLSEYIIDASVADAAQIPSLIAVDYGLPDGAEAFRETIKIEGMDYIKIGVRERFKMAREWMSLLMVAEFLKIDPSRVTEDWCWQKLPAYELEPATSTAQGEEFPHATLSLSSAGQGSVQP